MTLHDQLVTAEQLLHIPDDGFRYELVEGVLRHMSPAGHEHGRIVLNLSAPLHQHVRAQRLGAVYAAETGFKLRSNPDTVRAPDLAFVRQERVEAARGAEGYWPGAPDLAVEVISPGDLYTEVEEKVIAWLDAGTRLVLVVNPRHRIVTVYRSLSDVTVLTEGETLDGADVIPGWVLAVREIFE